MGDMYNYENGNNAYSGQNHRSSDEISFFLHQIFLRSSSSSVPQAECDPSGSATLKDGNLDVDLCNGETGGLGGGSLNVSRNVASKASSSSIGRAGRENDSSEGDYEYEEGLEALVDEMPAKPAPPRSTSKRSRAAEVHNLSEKRRRSRINEKMKALQNLIPNSNKTDKASMLDEAIEYLKQLQLQVQMLSLRNGFSLHPMCLPGLLQPIQFSHLRTGFVGEDGLPLTMPLNQENQPQTMFGLQDQGNNINQLSETNMSNAINPEISFCLGSSSQARFGPFPPYASSQEICKEDALLQQLDANHSESNPSEFEMQATARFPLSSTPESKRTATL